MMTEDEWLAGVWPGRMLQTVKRYAGGRPLNRKCRRLTCYLLRGLAPFAPGGRFLHAVETAERHLDGAATHGEVAAAVRAVTAEMPTHVAADPSATNALQGLRSLLATEPFVGASTAISPYLLTGPGGVEVRTAELAALLHELFGNPFRPVPFAPAWRTGPAVALARIMDESRTFDRMPILADALEEAGCEVPAVLDHCRDPDAVHVRGCWVVDGVLGQS